MLAARHIFTRAFALFSLFGALLLAAPVASAAKFPTLNESRVVDDAKILTSAEEAALAEKVSKIESETGNQLAVATVASLQGMEIEDYGLMLGRRWKIGLAGVDNGLMIIVAPKDRKTRIEVGIGLEDRITNPAAQDIIDSAMIPRFKERDFAAGIGDAIDMIAARLTDDQPQTPAGTLPLVNGDLVSAQPPSSYQSSAPEVGAVDALFALLAVAVVFLLFIVLGMGLAGSGGARVSNWNSARSSVYVHSSPSVFSSSASPSSSGHSNFSSGGSSSHSSSSSSSGGRFRGGGASGSW